MAWHGTMRAGSKGKGRRGDRGPQMRQSAQCGLYLLSCAVADSRRGTPTEIHSTFESRGRWFGLFAIFWKASKPPLESKGGHGGASTPLAEAEISKTPCKGHQAAFESVSDPYSAANHDMNKIYTNKAEEGPSMLCTSTTPPSQRSRAVGTSSAR